MVDVQGREVRVVADTPVSAGFGEVTWDLKDEAGRLLPSGVYFARMQMGESVSYQKLVVAR